MAYRIYGNLYLFSFPGGIPNSNILKNCGLDKIITNPDHYTLLNITDLLRISVNWFFPSIPHDQSQDGTQLGSLAILSSLRATPRPLFYEDPIL